MKILKVVLVCIYISAAHMYYSISIHLYATNKYFIILYCKKYTLMSKSYINIILDIKVKLFLNDSQTAIFLHREKQTYSLLNHERN